MDTFKIIVNSKPVELDTQTLTYEMVCDLVGQPGRILSVMYCHAMNPDKADGTLIPGQSVSVRNGTIIKAANTGSA